MKKIPFSKIAAYSLISLLLLLLVDLGIAIITVFVSMKPKRVYHSIVNDKTVEIIFSPQGAFGKDWLTVKENGELVGEAETNFNIKRVSNVEFLGDSIIVYSLGNTKGKPDTTVIHRINDNDIRP